MVFERKLKRHKARCDEVDEEIMKLHGTGLRIIQIARTIPIGERCVRNCLRERGLVPPLKPRDITGQMERVK